MEFLNVLKTCIAFLVLPSILSGQTLRDPIIGVWLTADEKSHIEIYKDGSEFKGKIIWVLDSIDPNTKLYYNDIFNKDANLRNRTIKNLVILSGFYKDGHKYKGGNLYHPRTGKSYRGKMWLSDENTLNLRGYYLVIHATDVWKRIK